MAAAILIVGALGNVGRAAVASLQKAGLPVRACHPDLTRVHELLPGAEAVILDPTDPATFRGALGAARDGSCSVHRRSHGSARR